MLLQQSDNKQQQLATSAPFTMLHQACAHRPGILGMASSRLLQARVACLVRDLGAHLPRKDATKNTTKMVSQRQGPYDRNRSLISSNVLSSLDGGDGTLRPSIALTVAVHPSHW